MRGSEGEKRSRRADGSLSLPARILRISGRAFRGVTPVLVLIAITLFLGYWGLSELPGETGDFFDKLYRTAQLLGIQGDVPDTGTPWQLNVARFLAPLIIPYAALVAVFAVLGGRAQRMRLRLFGRDHMLIVGAGSRGSMLARALRDSDEVVLMELDGKGGAATSLRRSDITVLEGDATDPESLEAGQPRHAREIILLAGDDSVNLEILAMLQATLGAEAQVPIHVAIDSPALWAQLHRLSVGGGTKSRVEFLNVPDRIARALTTEAFRGELKPTGDRRIAIWGDAATMARMTVQILRSVAVGAGTRIVLCGGNAARCRSILLGSDRWAFDAADVALDDETDAEIGASLALIAGLGEAEALEAAAILSNRMPSGRILVEINDEESADAIAHIGYDLSRIELVPARAEVLGRKLLEESAFERIARGRHEEYLRTLKPAPGEEPKPTQRPWDVLDREQRRPSLAFADGVPRILDAIGAELVPLTGQRDADLTFPDDILEYLAIHEHNRWWASRARDGWGWAERDDYDRKLHASMVPWDLLPEEACDRDRDSIRCLPRLLRDVGYEIDVPGEAEMLRLMNEAKSEADDDGWPASWMPKDARCRPPGAWIERRRRELQGASLGA